MKKYKAIVFDMDGTVLDTLDELTKSLNYVFACHGLPAMTQEAIRPCLGFGYDGFIDKAAPDAPESLRRMMTKEFIAYYSARCQTTTFPYPGIPQVLGRLKAAGYHMAIVSNKGQGAVSELHDEYFKDYVGFSLGETPMYRKKPAPDMVWEALKRLGCAKEDAIYVGDSEVDKETADNAGLDVALVTWGFRDRDLLESLQPTYLIDTREELGALFGV
ncbi:MAG: HAD-IA family hydrolase [Megasphaera sp.]|uniref:HAD family hydrolase n=1 Tax=Megasphaera sp. TaxID=2023260 RepID=UPI0025C5D83A|nr:HAD-IA family hydrolase [Megasphaera sp.]MCF0153867.1 HAD-IA family hydrolase [Megasphaera sp.]MCI7600309.1 HAD-IA family hydrolase [Megasphaera sp.]